MAYRKFRAEQLFDGYQLLDDQQVLVTTDEGVVEEIVAASEAGDNIMELKGILTPGLVNCHGHLELSHMKGMIPEGTGLAAFVFDVVTQRHLPEDTILSAIERAEDEMWQNGIVAAGDICNNLLTLPQKLQRRIHYHNFIEASGFDPRIAGQRFERSAGFFREYEKKFPGCNSIVPHAPYSVAKELWEMIVDLPGNHLLTIHNQETAAENEWFIDGSGDLPALFKKMGIDTSFFTPSGRSSLQTYLLKFLKNQSLVLVHNVHTPEEDILFAQQSDHQIAWCFCPNANRYIGGQLPAIDTFIKHNCLIVLGTDSLASNHQLSILEEIRTIRGQFPGITTSQFLKWATLNGARALQMDKLLGSFEHGKKPGLVLCQHDLSGSQRLL